MARKLRNVLPVDIVYIGAAIDHLAVAQANLRAGGADKAADYVARCRKSAWGAYMHAQRILNKTIIEEKP